jgi:hypothetical protein
VFDSLDKADGSVCQEHSVAITLNQDEEKNYTVSRNRDTDKSGPGDGVPVRVFSQDFNTGKTIEI